MKIVFAAPYFLLDIKDGGAGTVRNLLRGLSNAGHEVFLVSLIEENDPSIKNTKAIKIFSKHGVNIIGLPVFGRISDMSMSQAQEWFSAYVNLIDVFKPDWVLTYGGQVLDMHVSSFAKYRNIKVGFLLLNLTYTTFDYCLRDADALFADSHYTAEHYTRLLNRPVEPIGVFLDPDRCPEHVKMSDENDIILMINPVPHKGGFLMAQVIHRILSERDDIKFRVVNAFGDIHSRLNFIGVNSQQYASNIEIIDHFTDLHLITSGVRILLVPSLLTESFGMVVAEAKLNGIPSVATNLGGLPEAVGQAGSLIEIDTNICIEPYDKLMSTQTLEEFVKCIYGYFDDSKFYNKKRNICISEAEMLKLERRTKKFEQLLFSRMTTD